MFRRCERVLWRSRSAPKGKSSGGRAGVFRAGSVALGLEELHRKKRIEKIRDAAGMQSEFLADLGAGEPALTQFREKSKRDCGEQDFGISEAEGSLQNCVRCWRGRVHEPRFSMSIVALLASRARPQLMTDPTSNAEQSRRFNCQLSSQSPRSRS